ncbi:winged helix-turn-helix domain-containing protein [Fulvimarina sp. 2208YS6-2-32]|uniref:Winged helix-turn-helix domain-containing protein n=1 Tax=Fulvimarina uroteuthidis TaxID=3098149 RepID=A0ABU5I6V2_9HYPH|nr:winged helix-turn-helix domain-containing protein [Fulvimarina sp. 2208YS6-2-32]MDY8111122.1 winged helix-turn-helix domain-containing protein [Fulvimarina sp. 2208YS6-2-32]
MAVQASSKLDIAKFAKVHSLMNGGATDGERSAARARAEAMASKAGMTLKQAVSSLDAQPKAQPFNFFEGFDDWMEEKEPGWKAQKAREKAERKSRDDICREEVLARYGSEEALFARTEQEAALDKAIEPLATWEYWTDDDGTRHRFPKTMDGKTPKFGTWYFEDITPAIREAVTNAYPWPSNLDAALKEVKAWERLRRDRALFSGGEWSHYPEVECRFALLEKELNEGRPATSWSDIQARFDWKRYEFEREWIDPTERKDPFLDRLEADFANLRKAYAERQTEKRSVPTTNAQKRAAVLSMLDTHPELSDREIARRIGVSPQTVNTWRRKRNATNSEATTP